MAFSVKRVLTAGALTALGCGKNVEVGVDIVNPCNQQAIQAVDFLRLEPRGDGIDSRALSTTLRVADGASQPLPIPLTPDFQLVVTGHKDEPDSAPAAIGVSAKYDLMSAKDAVSVRLPFSLIDTFYKTTALDDPSSCSSMAIPRYGATATLLPQSGKVLIIGGITLQGGTIEYRRTIEMYDPATGKFDPVGELKSGGARAFHTATLLDDGRVLIAGGQALVQEGSQSVRRALRSALIVDATDPANVLVSDGIVLKKARYGHTAARLADGRVVLIGGRILNAGATRPEEHEYVSSIEIFDPDKGLFVVPADSSGATAVELSEKRFGHSGTLLKTGRDILVAGGFNEAGPVRSLELVHFDGDAVSIIKTSSAATAVGPIFHSAALAQDGRVLLSGGYNLISDAEPSGGMPQNPSSAVEMWEYRDATRDLIRTCDGAMNTARGYHTVSMVGRRAIFVGGRTATGSPTATAEVVSLAVGSNCFFAVPTVREMSDARAEHTAVTLASGEILVVGGRQQMPADQFGSSISSAEVFSAAREP